MKTVFLASIAFLLASGLQAKTITSSKYTDLDKDCIVVSSATDKAPVDFYSKECSSFGGYTLKEEGGDLRYSPTLSFHGQEINLQAPASFHQMASGKVEWVYDLTQDEEGAGSINFKALIYRLGIDSNPLKTKNATALYVVRLAGAQSCVIGRVSTNQEARSLANNASAKCVELSN